MNLRAHYQLDLIFSGPLISQAAGTLKFGVDAAMQRYRGKPVLNGSLVKGNIRSTLEEFSALLDHSLDQKISRWFGAKSENKDERFNSARSHHYDVERASVDFDCFWTLEADGAIARETQRTRIEIDEEYGTVHEGSLQVIEDCFPSGGPAVTFRGKLLLRYRTNDEKRDFIEWLGKALDYVPAMGSFKGIGFGKLEGWKLTGINPKAQHSRKPARLARGVTRFGVMMTIDRPFCLGRPKTPESNRIVSAVTISGNVIKALIAREYDNDSKQLNNLLCFDELIIGHGLPSKQSLCRREPPLALSLAIVDDEFKDMSSVADEAQCDFQKAPQFQPDWKDTDKQLANRALDRPETNPGRYLMVRTEINQALGVSEEGRLFSLECIDPYDYVWCSDIELCRIPEHKQAAVFVELHEILKSGLCGMGKTKAAIEFEIVPAFKKPSTPSAWRDDLYIVRLVTPARLLPMDLTLAGVNSHDGLKKLYARYWKRQHPGIELKTFFAAQELTGSYYFQRKYHHAREYRPEWLTVAGSVFVLRIAGREALKILDIWQKTGLPAHNEPGGGPIDWQSTPYLPEHGFGEINVNDPKQLDSLFESEQASA